MCGLFGIIGPEIYKVDFDIFDELMLLSSTRGIDGTGAYAAKSHTPTVNGTKVVGDTFYWRANVDKRLEDRFYSISNSCVIGHTRWRSVGNVEIGAVQPFRLKNIIGTHNGTIKSVSWETVEEGKYKSDSHAVLSVFDNFRKEPTKVLEALTWNDAYAFVWFDTVDNIFHMARNNRRELWYAINKKRKVAYWASESRFLDFVLDKEDYVMFEVEPYVHYKIAPNLIKYCGEDKTPFFKEAYTKPEAPTNVVHIEKAYKEPTTAQGSFFTYNDETGVVSDIPFDVDAIAGNA